MGEYVNEQVFPVLEGRELYLPKCAIRTSNSVSFNRLKLRLREFEKSFNGQRCENFDLVATYRPYHFNGEDFGLYLYAEMFSMLFLSILQRTALDFREAHTLALDSVLTHGSFHYLFERYGTLAGNNGSSEDPLIYPMYKEQIYKEFWGTAECYEETLANAFIFLAYPLWDRRKKGYLEFLIQKQREGYCQALDVTSNNLQHIFNQLEAQILMDRSKDCSSLSHFNLPSLQDYIMTSIPFRFLGLPVYLVNDCNNAEDFNQIVEILFPRL